MSERYRKRFHLERRLYASGAPVIIENGALLLDAHSNAALCQLVFRNIQDRPIKSLRAVVQLLDGRGKPLGKPVDHRYLDLDLKREQESGRESAIVLPSAEARSFTVRLSQVSFADGEVWTDEGEDWLELPEQPTLEEFCGGREKAEKLRKRLGEDCRCGPLETEELWFCYCGAVNPAGDTRCHRCKRRKPSLPERSGEDRAEPRDEEEQDFGEERKKKPRGNRKKLLPWALGGAVLAAAAALLLFLPHGGGAEPEPSPTPEDPQALAYEEAVTLLQSGDYDAAEAAFAALGDYEDSADYVERGIPYRRARLMQEAAEAGQEELPAPLEMDESELTGNESATELLYLAAAQRFDALGDYEDSPDRAVACRETAERLRLERLRTGYREAAELLAEGSYLPARDAFLALGDYEDSAELAQEAVYRKAMALYRFAEGHDTRGVKARLSLDAEAESLFHLPRERTLELGSQGYSELQNACGKDPIRFVTEDYADAELIPLEEAVAELFTSLGDYKDSAELAAKLPDMVDRSDEFFALCRVGNLAEAREWLDAYSGEFADRELWEERLALYLPFCRSWELLGGDPSLAAGIGGRTERCYTIRCVVVLQGDEAVLRLLLQEGEAEGPELRAEMGDNRFFLRDGKLTYLAVITKAGYLSLAKYYDSQVRGGAEYLGK